MGIFYHWEVSYIHGMKEFDQNPRNEDTARAGAVPNIARFNLEQCGTHRTPNDLLKLFDHEQKQTVRTVDDTLSSLIKLRSLLKSVDNLLTVVNNSDTPDCFNYFAYCRNIAVKADKYDKLIQDVSASLYGSNRRGVNIKLVNDAIEDCFTMLDEIDTASDMFNPVGHPFISIVMQLAESRTQYAYISHENGCIVNNGVILPHQRQAIKC